ncbi:helix-turn-helix domain-containing protein [Lachnospiraceae bacterium OttesenSCG-928-D06]|nr:helix-turn-helix domain-containing protein [Lachnospiraceae bacterium OttesenSCG-928-D06]
MKNLKELRKQAGLSQQALAEHFNLTQQSIYKYENGLAEPDIDTLKSFSHFFCTSIDYLVGATDDISIRDLFNALNPSEEEIQLIKKIRGLTPDIQNAITLLVNNL